MYDFYPTFAYGLLRRAHVKILLHVKLTFFLILFSFLQVGAKSFAQITIKENSTSLENVLQKIRKQGGYDFFYSNAMLKVAKPVTIDVKNASVEDVLNIAFKEQPLTYTINQKTIILKFRTPVVNDETVVVRQQLVVIGKIVDEDNKPVSGASVRIKGLVNPVAISDQNGIFRIVSPNAEATLVITFIGYEKQEINLKDKKLPLTIKLAPEASQLNQVVINTGLFKKADQSFTGASTTVTAKELAEFGNRNLITSLRNIDPSFNIIESNAFGSNPNRLPEIQIRGNSSIPNVGQFQDQARAELNTPLIILDGFQSTLQKLYDMNENEVESITILKDASATAMYGSRGSNGVIVITTKAPRPGKLRLSLKSDINFEMPDLTDYSLLKAADKLDLEWKAGYYNNVRAESDLPLKRYYNYLLNEVNRGVETDWMALPLRNGIGQRHFLKIEGGENAFRYSASGQVNNIEGVMKGSFRHTFNGNITLAYTYKTLKFRNNLQVQQGTSQESPYGKFSDYVRQNPYWAPYDDKGNVLKFLGDPGNSDYSGYWTQLPTNPLYNATLKTFDKTATTELINNTSVEWNVIPDMTLRAQFGLTKGNVQYDKFRPAEHTAFANYGIDDLFRKGDYNYSVNNYFGYDGSLNLQYNKLFGRSHLLTFGADYNIRQNQASTYSFLAEGFPNANFDFITMALQYAKDGKPTGNESLVRSIGITGNVNYSYNNKYFVDASFRMDGSSQFGSDKRYAPFWSVGAGYNLHNESFLKDNKYINRLKIRGSVGTTGAQNFNAYQALSTYQYYTSERYYNWMGAYLLGLGNTNLQWQQTIKYNVGIDAEFLNRRLRFTGDYYTETTKDLVSSVNLPASNGFTSYVDNIGSLRNNGFELKATGFIINNTNGFTWSVSAAVLHNKNKIISTSKALKDAQAATLNGTTSPGTLYIEGYSSNAIWVVPSLGIDPSTGKELYLGKDGLPTYTWKASDIVAVGSRDPKLYGNFSSMLRYKDFSINASFRYSTGGQQYNSTLVDRVELTSYKYNVDSRVYYSRWQQPGDIAAFKGLLVTSPTYKSSRFVQDEKTLVLQNVNFQYNIANKQWLKKIKMESLNVTLNAAEPFYLSSIKRERGTDYPFSRQFSLSVNATF